MVEMRFAPLRSLADFALGSARFGFPDLKDPARCNNRIVSNLLYYQSNYLLVVAAILLVVGYMQPLQMTLGALILGCIFMAFVYASENHLGLRRFRRNHSVIYTAALLAATLLLLQFLGCILVFLFGIALPILVTLVHASLRLRNVKNKIGSKVELFGPKRSLMGYILEAVGVEPDGAS
uniref:PRA1 family protein 3-like n=1 Tax=Myxine glutinosa TaxID=7769 RepID=UPI00358E9B58